MSLGSGVGVDGRTLSTLLPTTIRTTEGETYVSSSEYQRGRASKESRLETSYTVRGVNRRHVSSTVARKLGMDGGGHERDEIDMVV